MYLSAVHNVCGRGSQRLRMRPRTTHRAAEHDEAMECFVSLDAQTNPPAGRGTASRKDARMCLLSAKSAELVPALLRGVGRSQRLLVGAAPAP